MKNSKKFLAALLVCLMLTGTFCTTALAADKDFPIVYSIQK